jgi:hypothetical protein
MAVRSRKVDTIVAAIVLLVAALVLYVLAYRLLVMRGVATIDEGRGTIYPYYRIADAALRGVFAPAHWLDRRMRPSFWTFGIEAFDWPVTVPDQTDTPTTSPDRP